ncbi:hypothetical protein BHE74_00044697 [Ensete ventricosum]|nr:hypothetical protein BHE74_00044697 [Ensete ventricosum]
MAMLLSQPSLPFFFPRSTPTLRPLLFPIFPCSPCHRHPPLLPTCLLLFPYYQQPPLVASLPFPTVADSAAAFLFFPLSQLHLCHNYLYRSCALLCRCCTLLYSSHALLNLFPSPFAASAIAAPPLLSLLPLGFHLPYIHLCCR